MHKRIISLLLIVVAAAGCRTDSRDSIYGNNFEQVIQQANSKVFPTVVFIRTVRKNLESGRQLSDNVSGSGVIISPDGEVLTNYHVIDKASSIRCQLNTGVSYEAKIVGGDKDVDLALLKLDLPAGTPPLKHAELEHNPVKEGEFVMAMGAPWGLNRSVSLGIVSCANRYLPEHSQYTLWIQTDASISPGNSGGPLVNTKGKVIGLNSIGIDGQGTLGFALPTLTINEVLPQLRKAGQVNWAWTGLELQPLQDFDHNIYFNYKNGVMISGTLPNSPAAKTGFRANDRIIAINNHPVTVMTEEELPALERFIGLMPTADKVAFKIIRDSREIVLELSMTRKGAVEGDEAACARWGFTAKTINRFDNPLLYFHRPDGVFVFGVAHNGNASHAGIHDQDIIVSINGRKIDSLKSLREVYNEAMGRLDQKTKAQITILRNGVNKQLIIDYSIDNDKE